MTHAELVEAINDLRQENNRRFNANMRQAEEICDLRRRLDLIQNLPLVQWALNGGHVK